MVQEGLKPHAKGAKDAKQSRSEQELRGVSSERPLPMRSIPFFEVDFDETQCGTP